MTREQIEQLNELEPFCFETTREEQWYKVGLKEGLRTADTYHKSSPWISVEDDLPYNHEEFMEDNHYTKSVLAVLTLNEDPSKKQIEVCCMCNILGSVNVDWYWSIGSHYQVAYWMPLPEIPN